MARRARGPRPKHVPQRTCIACRQTAGKRGLIRLVRSQDGVVVDLSGKMAGRGAYLHPSKDCWETALGGNRIQQALRTKLSEEDRLSLAQYMDSLPEETESKSDIHLDRNEIEEEPVNQAGRT